jgi:homogentisate phytyltransferase / homogentisate geranylgeranyltransferase
MSATPVRAAEAEPARPWLVWAGIVWRFSRPHTVIGTTVSVITLYAIAAAADQPTGALDLGATLVVAWCVNVAIVGLNQIEDVEIDRINKPQLPMAAGELGRGAATRIVAGTTIVAIAMAISQGMIELVAVLAALGVGAAYSSPPLRLKRFPLIAAISISAVRALAVNLGVYGHFVGSLEQVPTAVWALTAFVAPFSVSIALLKDVPDVAGDARHRVRTLSVRIGTGRVFVLALGILTAAYLAMAVPVALVMPHISVPVFSAGHLAALVLLLAWARETDPDDPSDFTRFYLRVWQLFFFEYVLVAFSFAVAPG